MKITNERFIFTVNSTIGRLSIDGQLFGVILEPYDRGLENTMSLDEIQKIKVYGHTAIAPDTYELIERLTDHFPPKPGGITGTASVPELVNVKDFAGIWIHPGNYPKDTLGCSLIGKTIAGADFIGQTWVAFDAFKEIIMPHVRAHDCSYTISRDIDAWNKFKASDVHTAK